jgi:glycosyltransferase involved in cell wall biosynthesis
VRDTTPRVLIIVQNLPVPLDRRVWMECRALRAAGYGVSVICPKGPGDPWHHEIEGVRIYKYPPPPAARGALGYAWEFAYCWIVTALLSILVAWRDRFDVIQACNPPDTFFLLGKLWRLRKKKFVYDQHDLNPEVFLSRFGTPTSLAGRAQLGFLRFLERGTYREADHVISTNESYRGIALSRGGKTPADVTVVRSGPDTAKMRPIQPQAGLRPSGRPYLAVYLGIMGPQDGVDVTLRALDILVHQRGRTDCSLALLGFGDCLEELKELAAELKLTDYVTFTGRVGPDEIAAYLSTADLGLCPDPKSPLNDVSTMNKTMEYMAYALPVLSFDLVETRVSAQEAARYIEPGDIAAFAAAWDDLLTDDDLRVQLGTYGRQRVSAELDWLPQSRKYVDVYRALLGPADLNSANLRAAAAAPEERDYIDLADNQVLAEYVRDRGRAAAGHD